MKSKLVTLSSLPLGLLGIGALSVAVSGFMSEFGNPVPWLVVGLAIVASAIGVARGQRWAFIGEGIVGVILLIGVLFITLFSLAMASATSGGLDGNMFGTPFGILNGWASLALYAVGLAVSIWLIAAARLGLRSATSP